MYKAALFLNILLLFRRQARFASIGAQKKMFQPEQNTPWLEREKILHRLCFLITHEHSSGARFLSLGRANSVQADLLAGEQGLDTGFEGGELRRVEAFGAADDGGRGLLGRLERL